MIIGILFFILFFALLAKAIFETVWGLCLVIHGLFWHAIAITLRSIAHTIRLYKKIERTFKNPRTSVSNRAKHVYGV
jgi:hypothetical protein